MATSDPDETLGLFQLIIEFVQLGTPGEIEAMLVRRPELLGERAGEAFVLLRRHWAETGKERLVQSTAAHWRLLRRRRAAVLIERGNALLRSHEAGAIDCYRQAADAADTEPEGWRARVNLAQALAERGVPADAAEAEDLLQSAVGAPNREVRELAWTQLGHLRLDTYRKSYEPGLLDAAERAYTEALASHDSLLRRANLGAVRLERFRATGDGSALDEVIASLEPRQRFPSTVLGEALRLRFEAFGGDDLDRAIDCFAVALQESPPGSLDEASAVGNLAGALTRRYDLTGMPADREQAGELAARLDAYDGELPDDIAAQRASVDAARSLAPRLPRAGRAAVLNNLGTALSRRYDAYGDVADLEELVRAYEEAVDATPPASPQLAVRLGNLGDALRERAHRLGDEDDLRDAVGHLRRAHEATNPYAPSRADRAAALATALLALYKVGGAREDLEAASRFAEEAVLRTGTTAPVRPGRLTLFASCLHALSPNDATVAGTVLHLMRTALDATPPDAPVRVRHRHNVAQALAERARLTGVPAERAAALEEFASTWREAVTADPATAVSAGRNWGDAAAGWSDWAAAAEGYLRGLATATGLVVAQKSRSHREGWLRDAQHLPPGATLALSHLGLVAEATALLERSRALHSDWFRSR